VTVNSQTGVGVYLMGADRFADYVDNPNLDPRSVTVAVINHHLESSLNWETKKRKAIPSLVGSRKGQPMVAFVPEVEWLEQGERVNGLIRLSHAKDLLDELHYGYKEQVRIALRESFPEAQSAKAAPKDCPDRFRKYFKQ
jgi:hypothetical protein